MALGKSPDPAVHWNTKQETENCSLLSEAHQACNGERNSRLHTWVLTPGLVGLVDSESSRTVSITGKARTGKAGGVREESKGNSGWYRPSC